MLGFKREVFESTAHLERDYEAKEMAFKMCVNSEKWPEQANEYRTHDQKCRTFHQAMADSLSAILKAGRQ